MDYLFGQTSTQILYRCLGSPPKSNTNANVLYLPSTSMTPVMQQKHQATCVLGRMRYVAWLDTKSRNEEIDYKITQAQKTMNGTYVYQVVVYISRE